MFRSFHKYFLALVLFKCVHMLYYLYLIFKRHFHKNGPNILLHTLHDTCSEVPEFANQTHVCAPG